MRSLVCLLAYAFTILSQPFAQEAPVGKQADAGVLQIYARMTQVGTVAKRTFRDAAGRVYKTIFYTGHPGGPPHREDELVPQSIQLSKYDGRGLLIRVETYTPAMTLSRTLKFEYDQQGNKTRSWFIEADGIRRYEMRHAAKGGSEQVVSHLYFDNTGSYLISIRGRLAGDVDLPHGWGNPVDGLACGVVMTRERGPFSEMAFSVNIKNIGGSRLSIGTVPEVDTVLKDASGRRIAEHRDSLPPGAETQDHSRYWNGPILPPGEAGHIYPAYELPRRYQPLAPGRYSLYVRLQVAGVTLQSNEETFVIE